MPVHAGSCRFMNTPCVDRPHHACLSNMPRGAPQCCLASCSPPRSKVSAPHHDPCHRDERSGRVQHSGHDDRSGHAHPDESGTPDGSSTRHGASSPARPPSPPILPSPLPRTVVSRSSDHLERPRHLVLQDLARAIEAVEAGHALDRIEARLLDRERAERELEASGTDAESIVLLQHSEVSEVQDVEQVSELSEGRSALMQGDDDVDGGDFHSRSNGRHENIRACSRENRDEIRSRIREGDERKERRSANASGAWPPPSEPNHRPNRSPNHRPDRRPDHPGSSCRPRVDSGVHELFSGMHGAADWSANESGPAAGVRPSSVARRSDIWLPPLGAAIGWLWRLIDWICHGRVIEESDSRPAASRESGHILWVGARVFPHTRALVGGLRGDPRQTPDTRLLDRSWFVDVPDSPEGGRPTSRRRGRGRGRGRGRDRSVASRNRSNHRTWILEQAIRCPGVTAVVADAEGLPMACTRRLHLALRQSESQGHRVLVLLLRPPWDRGEISAATSRWSVSPTAHDAKAIRDEGMSAISGVPRLVGAEPVRFCEPGTVAWRLQMLHCKGGLGARSPDIGAGLAAAEVLGRPPSEVAHQRQRHQHREDQHREDFTTLRMDEWECRDGRNPSNPGAGASGVDDRTCPSEASARTRQADRARRTDRTRSAGRCSRAGPDTGSETGAESSPVTRPVTGPWSKSDTVSETSSGAGVEAGFKSGFEPGSHAGSVAFHGIVDRTRRLGDGSTACLPGLHDSHARFGDRTGPRGGDELGCVATGAPPDADRRSRRRAGTRRADRRGSADRQALLFEMSEAGGAAGTGARRSSNAAR